MAKIKFQGAEYEIPAMFTNREFMEIERISGVPASQIDMGHYGVMIAIAKVTLERHGAHKAARALLDADMGSVEYEGDEEEDDASPPADSPPSPPALTAVPGEDGGQATSAASST